MCEYCEPQGDEGLTYCLDSAGWNYLEECQARIVDNFLRFTLKVYVFYKEIDLEFDFKVNCCPMCGRVLDDRQPVDKDACESCKPVKSFLGCSLGELGISPEELNMKTYFNKMPNTRYEKEVEAYDDGKHLCLWIDEEMFGNDIRAEFKFEIYNCPFCGEELGRDYED